MKNHDWPDLISVSDASRLTRKTRETVSRAARDLPAREGPGNAKLYEPWRLLQVLYVGEDGPTYSEAMRRLTLSRTALIDHELAEKKVGVMSLGDYVTGFQQLMAVFRGNLFANENKILSARAIDDCLDNCREYVIASLPEGERRAARKELCNIALEATAGRVEFLQKEVRRDAWHADCQDKLATLRAAYNATLTDKSESALAALEQARAEVRETADAEPRS